MADNKVTRLPRSVLAKAFDNNNQAIVAFEKMEKDVTVNNPKEIADLIIRIDGVTEQAEQAVIIATQLNAIAQQLIADIRPTLSAVSVPLEPSDYLQAVGATFDATDQLNSVGYYFEPASDNMIPPVEMK